MNGDTNHFHPSSSNDTSPRTHEEAMIADARSGLTPSQMVERRLASLLKATPLPLSRLQTTTRRPL